MRRRRHHRACCDPLTCSHMSVRPTDEQGEANKGNMAQGRARVSGACVVPCWRAYASWQRTGPSPVGLDAAGQKQSSIADEGHWDGMHEDPWLGKHDTHRAGMSTARMAHCSSWCHQVPVHSSTLYIYMAKAVLV